MGSENKNILLDFYLSKSHDNYSELMTNDKVTKMENALSYGKEYWDGGKPEGYGGYKYDGRWSSVANKIIDFYNLTYKSKVLEIGCGKGFLLFELQKILPGLDVVGIDASKYAIDNAKKEVKNCIILQKANDPSLFKKNEFDLVLCIGTLHDLYINELKETLAEIDRVGKNKFVVVESYRTIRELFNLQCKAITNKLFLSKHEWIFIFNEFGYEGDYSFRYFE